MAGDVVYADIRTPGSASRTSETRAANRRSDSQCPHWHRRTLWISGTLNIIAVLAFVGCGVWVFRSHQKSSAVECKWNNSSAGAQPAPSCPLDWQLHGRKCYYFSAKTDRKNWSTSHEDCSSRSSHLVVIEDKAELDYFTRKRVNQAWIGVFITPAGKRWTWVNGSTLNENVFRVTGAADGDWCGTAQRGSVVSSRCVNALNWICQKQAEVSSSRA
ncbi:killer cell lectin-like receptor subfamily B member 1B allele A [Pleurodeles waltl]|uniref:killer cell lectin-like receptor subfamily B member 1B allele A n=1 Tax=Pleurodeles waltl TaxID=8319 RepID=UPI0037095D57